jgi:hypothetical protein
MGRMGADILLFFLIRGNLLYQRYPRSIGLMLATDCQRYASGDTDQWDDRIIKICVHPIHLWLFQKALRVLRGSALSLSFKLIGVQHHDQKRSPTKPA